MEQVTVKELASEFEMRNSVVISELKKIGVWVPSAGTLVDSDIANRIRKRLQLMVEAEQEEKERKKAEKVKKVPSTKVRRSIKELGKPRKRGAAPKRVEEEEEKPPESPLAGSLKPRKGRKSTYRREEPVPEVEEPKKIEISIEDEPLIERVEAKVSEELLEKQPSAVDLESLAKVKKAPEKKEGPLPPPVKKPPVEKPAAEVKSAAPAKPRPPVEKKEPQPKKVAAPPPVEQPPAPAAAREEQPEKVKEVAQVPRPKKPDVPAGPKEVTFSEKVTVKLLGEKIGVKSSEVIAQLMQMGLMVNMNQVLDEATVEKVCETFDVIPSFVSFEEAAAREEKVEDLPEDLVERAPVVTVMGHVDHGKTTLLDSIRQARVAEGEAGGITQHIGAYQVKAKGKKIVFIDTPGHEAFTRMRARGAQATDIVVLVVAADDGVMPQTSEAIDHARAANVPMIVAVNKIDKPDSQPQRVRQELSDRGLIPEDWGGDTVFVEVSAIDGTNVDLLLEMVLLVADLQELKANPHRSASGVILEAKMEKGRGAVATLLVQNGSLKVGDTFIGGTAYGKVRAMFDDRGTSLQEVGPSSAVEVLGLQGVPQAGDLFQVVDDTSKAREMVEFRQEKQREEELAKSSKVSLDDLYAQMEAGEVKELPVVLKADTRGSVEVLEDTLGRLSTDKVKINVISRGVGAISESDVLLASASNAIVIGFSVRPEPKARVAAEQEEVEVRLYTVIYEIAQEIEQAMVGLLEPTFQEKYMGRAEVRETFKVPKFGMIGGCYINDGLINRNSQVRLLRDNVVIYEGKIDSLRRFKDDVNEVRSGYECGISIANYNDVKVGDVIEAFVKEEVAPQLT